MIDQILFIIAVNNKRLAIEETREGWRLMVTLFGGVRIPLASFSKSDLKDLGPVESQVEV